MTALTNFRDAVRADYETSRRLRERYPTDGPSMRDRGLLVAAVTQVGFQMLIVVRFMRLVRDLRIPGGAQGAGGQLPVILKGYAALVFLRVRPHGPRSCHRPKP